MSPDILARASPNFSSLVAEQLELALPMTAEQYAAYMMTETNIAAAIRRDGASADPRLAEELARSCVQEQHRRSSLLRLCQLPWAAFSPLANWQIRHVRGDITDSNRDGLAPGESVGTVATTTTVESRETGNSGSHRHRCAASADGYRDRTEGQGSENPRTGIVLF